MNPLSVLNNRTPASSYMPAAAGTMVNNKPAATGALQSGSDTLARRADDLGKATTDLAQNLMQSFATQLFGDAAKGMTFSFDKTELSSSSNFTAATAQTDNSSAAGFRLEDSSHFNGKGQLFTADGRRFDFEIDISYQSVMEGVSSSTTSLPTNQPEARPAQNQPVAAPAANPISGLNSQFAGTAEDLLKRLSSEAKPQPFQILKPSDDGQSLLKLLGTLSMQLLNLPGGPRHLDLSSEAPARLQEQA